MEKAVCGEKGDDGRIGAGVGGGEWDVEIFQLLQLPLPGYHIYPRSTASPLYPTPTRIKIQLQESRK